MNVTHEKPQDSERWSWLFGGIRPVTRSGAVRDALAGITLAAMNVPQALGYARIAGMPVVTGLYTLLLPLVAFAGLGSSRYLVVAADSATAAIIAGRLSQIAPVASEHYVALAGMVALLTAGCLMLARLFELGFLADFLSQTVLVGFLTGVGFQVGIAMLGEMLGVAVTSNRTVEQLTQIVRGLPQLHVPTLCVAVAVLAIIFVFNRLAPRLPGPLFAVVGAIAASAAFDFPAHGIAVIQGVTGGLPLIGLPNVSWGEIPPLLAVSASCFLMIVTQSAATARAYAARHSQTLDENTDLVGLSAANAAAALSGTFVVNGSPTQTAMVERSGGHSQIAQLATATIVAFVLLFLTSPLHYLPRCVLGAIVFTIAIGLVDVRGLRDIRRESPGEFRLALITAAVVVVIGVEQGILLAIALSLLWHVRHSYRPHTAVLVEHGGQWQATPAVPGALSGPGLVIFQFGSDLFYANAGRFAADVRGLIEGADPPVKWLVVDAGAITSVDYSAARVLTNLQRDLIRRSIALVLVHTESSLRADLHRHRLIEVIGADHIFDTLREALAAISGHRVHVLPAINPEGGHQYR
ncbi:MAG: SulP family inorganic anion transporter [Candidatus Binatus sp.]|uniref:SulP family inorganic anion transporter n=1 Tax=Candidatus Binatus sp. TaxID=2811406 RepID=UPI003C93127D